MPPSSASTTPTKEIMAKDKARSSLPTRLPPGLATNFFVIFVTGMVSIALIYAYYTSINFGKYDTASTTAFLSSNNGSISNNNNNNNNNKENTTIIGGGPCPRDHINSTIPSLTFIHIRKTGGTAIESIADKIGIQWGRKQFNKRPRPKLKLDRERFVTATRRRKAGSEQHIPPKYFRPYPYKNNATFAVIRNPYERIVSEYYQMRKGLDKRKKKLKNNKNPLNSNYQVVEKILQLIKSEDDNINDAQDMNNFLQEFIPHPELDLFIPQYEYIYNNNNERIVTHVLEFNNLNSEFDALMECYGINLTLPEKLVNGRQSNAELSVLNFTNRTMEVIHEYMRKDFELLGYRMIHSSASMPKLRE